MYDDSIVVDADGDSHHVAFRAFVGIAPRRFCELFEVPDESGGRHPRSEVTRKNVRWDQIRGTRWPRKFEIPLAIMVRENNELAEFNSTLKFGLTKQIVEGISS
jgi:hypothetical protein